MANRRYRDNEYYDYDEMMEYDDVPVVSRNSFRDEDDYSEHYRMKKKKNNSTQNYKTKNHKQPKKKRKLFVITLLIVALLFFVGGFIVGYMVFDDKGDAEATNTVTEQTSEEVAAVSAPVYAEATSDYERVINRSYPIEPGYIAGTGELKVINGSGGKQMEKNAAIALEEMVAGLNDAGMDIIIQSTYRTDADQEYLYNRQIGRQGGNELKAATISAVPLTSEHQAGLAVDLSIDGSLTEAFGSTAQGKWLKEHCAEYGYILRYLPENVEYTGIISEPWHFRYVGSPEVAKAIMDSGKSMEEYYGKFLEPEDIDPYLPYLQ